MTEWRIENTRDWYAIFPEHASNHFCHGWVRGMGLCPAAPVVQLRVDERWPAYCEAHLPGGRRLRNGAVEIEVPDQVGHFWNGMP